MTNQNVSYEEYIAEMENRAGSKKAKKKAKKAAKEAVKMQKLKELQAIATSTPIKDIPYSERTEILSYTATGKPSKYTQEERDVFAARIENEKKNILRIGNKDPQQILHFCNANKVDEKNMAVRYAREAATTWALRMGAVATAPAPVQLPF